jgi:cytochrome c oxidase cbb3-type subunit 3
MAENNPFPGENNTGHYWDDNLRELANPPPSWWTIAFWASILWVIAYGILYPFWPTATSYTKGVLGWTQMQEYQEGVAQVQETRKVFEDQIAKLTPAEIAQDPGLSEYTVASPRCSSAITVPPAMAVAVRATSAIRFWRMTTGSMVAALQRSRRPS